MVSFRHLHRRVVQRGTRQIEQLGRRVRLISCPALIIALRSIREAARARSDSVQLCAPNLRSKVPKRDRRKN